MCDPYVIAHTGRLYKDKNKKIIQRHNAYNQRHPSPRNLEMKHNSYFVEEGDKRTYI